MRKNGIERFVGHAFHRLTVLEVERRQFPTGGVAYARCRCECGVEKWIALPSLQSGATKSCGCQERARIEAARLNPAPKKQYPSKPWGGRRKKPTRGNGIGPRTVSVFERQSEPAASAIGSATRLACRRESCYSARWPPGLSRGSPASDAASRTPTVTTTTIRNRTTCGGSAIGVTWHTTVK